MGNGPDASGEVHIGAGLENNGNGSENPSEPVGTSAHPSEPARNPDAMIDELRERIDDLKGEVEFYRDELRDRRHTTAALTDVIEAFRLTAQTNASKAERESERNDHQPRFFDEGDNADHEEPRDAV